MNEPFMFSENPSSLDDEIPLSILSYGNGPGFYEHLKAKDGIVTRVNLSEWENYEDFETRQPAGAPRDGETHSGADVGIFASGNYQTKQDIKRKS